MTLTQLHYIIHLEKYGSFIEAAEACNISQPALSMQIKKLEEELSAILFDRTKTPITPTQLGSQVLHQAKKVLHEQQQIFEITKPQTDQISGKIRIGVIPTIAPYILPIFINQLHDKYSNLEIDIEELTTDKIIQGIRDWNLDFGLLVTPLHQADLIEYPLFFEQLMAYVSTKSNLIGKKYIQSDELNLKNLWLLEEGHCLRNQIENFCNLKAQRNISSRLNFKTGSLETLIRLVDRHEGITLIPELAKTQLNDEQIKRVKPFAKNIPYREVSLITEQHFCRKATLNALIESIKSNLPKELLRQKPHKVLSID